ncbi:hypothetical protein M441DRAFT_430732 [Trichoderma asperellum CBS 433.97]|uniref:Zn(2)-C6 fungal-type domain-containing protein n=1 Tax=Trichoderma asperellum (strain ATCC 204424 / CBS 433.97 / NBRC 101777) TaxID=1042311 RepID=A0A2T3Z684_TRIA4|nr:hypothetical protein M441DRAFT_430732 [Trichoderma asperellum CBS 433.97]PTB40313.1 hypothetical protein M441DRAFT_430732 [Trichoderma asperellum CBS 433.97]
MVNPGHASKGCTTCKLRRIRCDYGRPFCLHCIKSKRICLAYNVRKKQTMMSHENIDYDNVAPNIHPPAATSQLTVSYPLSRPNHLRANYGASQSNIGFYPYRLVSTYGGKGIHRLVWDDCDNESVAGREHLAMAIWSILETLNKSFHSLRRPIQTIEARKDLLKKYGSATRQLREALTLWPSSSVLLIPIFHFSLYEMIVNLNSEDRTWQTHLSGLLIILQRIPYNTTKFTLTKAIEITDLVTDVNKALVSSTTGGLERASLLLDIVELQLRELVTEMDAIASNSPPPLRKLDIKKLQVSIKRICNQLDLFPTVVRDSIRSTTAPISLGNQPDKGCQNILTNDLVVMQWVVFYTLQIMTSAVLLKIGSFLYSDATYRCKREFAVLSHIIQGAAEGICSITTSYIGLSTQTASYRLAMPHIKTTQALIFIWPLFCVSKAPGLIDLQRNWAREVLWAIGEQCSIPKAMALVSWPSIKQLVPLFTLEGTLI